MKKIIAISLLLVLILSGCSLFRNLSDIREPSVAFRDVSIQSISFDGVTLLFDFDVTNPNSFGVSAEQYRYEFFINEHSFLTGDQQEGLSIGSNETRTIQVPVSMSFSELAETAGSLFRQDTISYKLSTEVEFDFPVAGRRTVPVEAGGNLPIPKMPRIEFGNFEVKQMSFNGAEVEISIRVSNPNSFGITLSRADYRLDVNGSEWLDTTLNEAIRVDASESKTIEIPIRLNAAQLGTAMREIVTGNKDFQYNLQGEAEISADLEGFGSQEIPFNLNGRYRLNKP